MRKEALYHFYIAMRTVTQGFAPLEAKGAFDKLGINLMDSYHIIIESVIDTMKKLANSEK